MLHHVYLWLMRCMHAVDTDSARFSCRMQSIPPCVHMFNDPPHSNTAHWAFAFGEVSDALRFAFSTQYALLFETWEPELLAMFPPVVRGADGRVVFSGPRVSMLLHAVEDAVIDQVRHHHQQQQQTPLPQAVSASRTSAAIALQLQLRLALLCRWPLLAPLKQDHPDPLLLLSVALHMLYLEQALVTMLSLRKGR
jgi:hypothetical protein